MQATTSTFHPTCSHHSQPQGVAISMAAYLLGFVFTGFSFENHRDDDFFNEPSTMRPRLTAAAAKEDGSTEHLASLSSPSTYQVVARGLPGAKIHYAAPSA
ncbi:hypothetical protein CLAIMM_10139 [Cladophialophora immunda]|nr:hypothetical protein CLAIMM_10139 [Cladophialophora immunda]